MNVTALCSVIFVFVLCLISERWSRISIFHRCSRQCLSETHSDFAFLAPALCKRLPPKLHRRRRRRCSTAFFNRAFSFGPVMFLAKPGHAERIPDTVECRASRAPAALQGSREQERDNGAGEGGGGVGGGGLASANAESPLQTLQTQQGPDI